MPSSPRFLHFPRLHGGKKGWAGSGGEQSCAAEGGNKARAASRGSELPELFTWGGGGVSLAWLLPISFTSGWAAALALPLESLARRRGVGWKSPSGWESHKCVNKCNDQSLLLCPGNSGLSWMAGGGLPGCELFPSPICEQGRLGRKSFGKRLFPRKTRVRCHATAIYVSSEQCND